VAPGVLPFRLNGRTTLSIYPAYYEPVRLGALLTMPRPNLLSLLDDFTRFSSDVAIVQQRGYRRETHTYKTILAIAAARALQLKESGVRANDRVLLWGPNSAEWVAAFWGCLMRGAVAVPIDDSSPSEFASRVAADSGVKFAFVSSSKPALSPAVPTFSLEDFPVTFQKSNPSAMPANAKASTQITVSSLRDEPIARTNIAEILFTSGTTSEPRGVVLTHGNFLANLEPIEQGIDEYRRYEKWFHPLRFVSLVPLSHVFGQFMALFVPPLLGATVVFENSPHPRDILRTIRRERATALIAVPRMLDTLRTSIEQEIGARGWRSWFIAATAACAGEHFYRRAWRFRRLHRQLGWKFWALISGGAALSPQTEEFFMRIGFAVVQGYGMTETASVISLNHPFQISEGTVGKILPGREFRLAPDGEILVRGENVSSGYFEKGAFQSRMAENEGWLGTGDLGELDAEGNLRFRGRKKNVIVTPAGLNIHPEDLEAALRRQPAVRDAVVIPLDSAANAEPLAILLLQRNVIPPPPLAPIREGSAVREGSEARDRGTAATSSQTMEPPPLDPPSMAASAAIDAANSSLAEYQRIRRWLIWPDPDFPRTPTGKPRLAVLASRAADLLGPAKDPVVPPALSAVREGSEARDLLSSSAPLPTTADLASMSSLDRVELLATLEHRYNVELNETQFADAKSTADLERLIAQPSARRSDFVYTRWQQTLPVRLIRIAVYYALTWPATLLLAHARILGREHLASLKGPFIFVANHVTRRADIGLVLVALPPRFRHRLAAAMGGEELREFHHPPREWSFAKRFLWRFKYFSVVSLFNVFPLPRFSGFRESFHFAGESVDRGYSILVFPEGDINKRDTPDMIPFAPGVGLLAQNLNIPVVPMRVDGLWRMQKEHRRLAHRGEVTVHIGAPVTFPPNTPPPEIVSRLQFLVLSL
jgi:long-chain acyl-CoA synthetase